jgi:thiosulfate dehydrogenase [quinone] large subunit
MRVTRTSIYILTAISAVLFWALTVIFEDGLWSLDHLWSQTNARGEYSVIAGTFWTYALFAAIIGAGLWQASRTPEEGIDISLKTEEQTPGQIHDPKWWRLLLGNAYLAVFWMPLRFFVGRDWLIAGEHKIREDAWVKSGEALKGFWTNAVTVPEGRPSAPAGTYDWYRSFLQYMIDHEWYSWFGKLIAYGEFLVGLGLIVGALVGIAAFFGTLMNFSFIMAGTASSNPVLFGLGIFLVLAWKVAGYVGLDRYLLPVLGTPWQRPVRTADSIDHGQVLHRRTPA